MNSLPLLRPVAKLFPQSHGLRTTNVALEQEFLPSGVVDGSVVEIERVRKALGRSAYEPWLSFEPGGQVELSLPPSPTVATLERGWRSVDLAVRADCLAAGVNLEAAPVARGRSVADVPLQLTSERYLRMQQHFDRIGPAGRRMMRLTASTQVCLDWWPGSAGLEQWRLALLTGPFLAATFNRDPGPQSRLAIWLAVDPGRTGFDARLLSGTDPVRTYAEFAAGATRFLETRTEHLTTLFPPVRPRRSYLEVRHLDAQPAAVVGPVASVLAALLYDDQARRQALRILEPLAGSLEEHWHDAAHRPERLADGAGDLLRLAETALPHGPAGYFPRDGGAWLRQLREDRSLVGVA